MLLYSTGKKQTIPNHSSADGSQKPSSRDASQTGECLLCDSNCTNGTGVLTYGMRRRRVATPGCGSDWKGAQWCPAVLLICSDLEVDYMDISSLQKFIRMNFI